MGNWNDDFLYTYTITQDGSIIARVRADELDKDDNGDFVFLEITGEDVYGEVEYEVVAIQTHTSGLLITRKEE